MPGAVSEVGGVVVDLVGTSGARVVTQLSANSLFVGFASDEPGSTSPYNPLTIGTQTGFTPAVVAALGGGIVEAAVRITLYDGDTGQGDFDDGQNTLLLNGIDFGGFSEVVTQETNSFGAALGALNTNGGFRDEILDTGFFYCSDVTTLSLLHDSLTGVGSLEIVFELDDVDPNDNFFDFTQGVDVSLLDVSVPPIVTSDVPEPLALCVWVGLGSCYGLATKRRRRPAANRSRTESVSNATVHAADEVVEHAGHVT